MRLIISCVLMALMVLLTGCTTVRYVPVIKKGARAKVPPELLEPSRRPVKRSPANTPLLEAGRYLSPIDADSEPDMAGVMRDTPIERQSATLIAA